MHGDVDIVRLRVVENDKKESKESDLPVVSQTQRKSKKEGFLQPELNPFNTLLDGDADDTSKDEYDAKNHSEALAPHPELPAPAQKKKRKKKRRKKKDRDSGVSRNPGSVEGDREDEVDVAIKEVSNMLGGLEMSGPMTETEQARDTLHFTRPLLCAERRLLNADNEMRKIFGSRMVQAEQNQQRGNRRTPLTPSYLIVGQRLMTKTASFPVPNEFQSITSNALTGLGMYLSTIIKHFWQRWKKEYLVELHVREMHSHYKRRS